MTEDDHKELLSGLTEVLPAPRWFACSSTPALILAKEQPDQFPHVVILRIEHSFLAYRAEEISWRYFGAALARNLMAHLPKDLDLASPKTVIGYNVVTSDRDEGHYRIEYGYAKEP